MTYQDSRRKAADAYKETKQMPETLQVLLVSRLHGFQTIHRAELTAVIVICESFVAAEFFSDSSFTVDIFLKVQACSDVHQFF